MIGDKFLPLQETENSHMISKNRIKEIKQLELKKYRRRTGLFVAEGHKLVLDLLTAFRPVYFAATEEWLQHNPGVLPTGVPCDCVTPDELQRASLQQNPQNLLALFQIPSHTVSLQETANENLVIALDGVQDPGNLGTIVRLADWFGIEHVFCSPLSADIFGPKAVQATMGALARVQVHYTDLAEELRRFSGQIYGTFLDGDDIYTTPLSPSGVIVMGNEGNGVSPEVGALVNARLFVPPFPEGKATSESLNVAVATAIVCAEFRRRVK